MFFKLSRFLSTTLIIGVSSLSLAIEVEKIDFDKPTGGMPPPAAAAQIAIKAQAADEIAAEAKDAIYPEGIVSIPEKSPFAKNIFVVDKTKRWLRVYQSENGLFKLIDEYPSDMGKKNGDKEKANDYKTPSGIYFLEKKLTQPEIPFSVYGSLAFATDYPNIFDKREFKTGTGIWLHAVPDKVALTRGSRGCVVVRNDVIKKLSPLVELKQTPLVIFDQVNLLNEKDFKVHQKKYLDMFSQWRIAWESQEISKYMRYYDSTFNGSKMNYKQWFRHKEKLKKLYTYIKVQISEPLLIVNKNQIVFRFFQKYESDKHTDYGEKTIHAKLTSDGDPGFTIIREEWRRMPPEVLNQITQ